eukprot:tig00000737_g3802.t1
MFNGENALKVDGSWNHLAITFTPTEIRTYLNGTFRPHAKTAGGAGGSYSIAPATRAEHVLLHSFWPGAPYPSGLDLSDFRVYGAALSPQQVLEVARGRPAVHERPPLLAHHLFDTCGETVRRHIARI